MNILTYGIIVFVFLSLHCHIFLSLDKMLSRGKSGQRRVLRHLINGIALKGARQKVSQKIYRLVELQDKGENVW